ncbi:IclR family transcriptional regulator [Candidatus Leptofilum sp.]|uniref:IclR family transcriptional regulator n=1 Tax=Candidatus Leptofilum sp. TaxID=3241576 RepID=UPI003B5ABD63
MNNANNKPSAPIQSIQRAAAILRSFTEAEPELGVSELSRRLNLHKSTVSRMIATLQAEGLIDQNPESGKYRLGIGLVGLAGVALGRLDARTVAQPHLSDLVAASQETVNVTALDGNECVNIERMASPQPIQYIGWIGRRSPLHCTASGKLILAHMTPEERTAVLPQPLRQYTDKTITDGYQLTRQLNQICQQKYAIVHEEYEIGFSSMAGPLYNHQGNLLATVSISGPTYRLNDAVFQEQLPMLLATCQKISAELGFLPMPTHTMR